MALFVAEEVVRQEQEISRAERLEQLERIVTSSHFRNSKRYPSFLRFVVERTVEENSEVLKERNLGTEIFGRPSDYDTNADPIVRVTAGEVRKRIAQYYQTPGHEHELKIELPLGSYVPHFYPAVQVTRADANPLPQLSLESRSAELALSTEPPPALNDVVDSASKTVVLPVQFRLTRRLAGTAWVRLAFIYTPAVIIFAIGTLLTYQASRRQAIAGDGIKSLWQPALSSTAPVLVVLGVHSTDSNGKSLPTDSYASLAHNEPQSSYSSMVRSDMVPVSDIIGFSRITDLLTARTHPYRMISSTETTLEELRRAPVILLGGFDNIWTMRLTAPLRYRFLIKSTWKNAIEDRQEPGKPWIFDDSEPARGNSRDYALIASYFDPTIEQRVLIAAGIGKNGTLAATEFITTEKYLSRWLTDARIPPGRNVEIVLSTDVLDGDPGPPHVVAFTSW